MVDIGDLRRLAHAFDQLRVAAGQVAGDQHPLFAVVAHLAGQHAGVDTVDAGHTVLQHVVAELGRRTEVALRRLTSPQRPLLAKAQRRGGGVARAAGRAAPRVSMLSKLASGALDVDPGRFVPSGLQGLPALGTLALPEAGDDAVALQAIGLPVSAGAAALRQLRADTTALTGAASPGLAPRSTLASTGMLDEAHLLRARELLSASTQPGTSLTLALGEVVKRRLPPGSGGVLVPVRPGTATRALPIGTVGTVDRIDTDISVGGTVGGATGGTGGTIGGVGGATGGVSGGVLTTGTITLPPPRIDLAPIQRLEASVTALAPRGQLGPVPPVQRFVGFDLITARSTLLARSNPLTTVPARLAGQLGAGGGTLLDRSSHGLVVAPTLDRILAAPEIDAPVYEYLAALAPERFLPGVGEIPDDAITLLETNPRFIESLLVGLNHEMNRELLWRGFPTDQRGTPLRRFWTGPMAAPTSRRSTAGHPRARSVRTAAPVPAARSRCWCAAGCCGVTRTRCCWPGAPRATS